MAFEPAEFKFDLKDEIMMFIGIFILVGFIGLGAFIMYNAKTVRERPVAVIATPAINSVVIKKPYLEVSAHNLGRVELWAVPTGTGVRESDNIFLGNAGRLSGTTDAQVWQLGLPHNELSITEIFAKGFDPNGTYVGRTTLRERGATAIYQAIWGATTEQATFRVGDEKTVNGLRFKLIRIKSDSRCPAGVQCVWAGNVVVVAELTAGGRSETVEIASDSVKGFGAYSISTIVVTPTKGQGQIVESSYVITYAVSVK